jgi:hypothetical protein
VLYSVLPRIDFDSSHVGRLFETNIA